ncbi:MAG: hypothetical protein ABFS32_08715 [Bacteroidota bacterium]
MGFTVNYKRHLRGKRIVGVLFFAISLLIGVVSHAQVDSRNQTQQVGENQFVYYPDYRKKKRLKSKRDPRVEGKKTYSNKKQLKARKRDPRVEGRRTYSNQEQKSRRRDPRIEGKKIYSNRKQLRETGRKRSKRVEQAYRGKMYRSGYLLKENTSPYVSPQPDPYVKRRIRTEKRRIGPPAPPVRTATRRGEQVRRGDISGQRKVRQRSARSARSVRYPQPNPYIGRRVKTEKVRAKDNTRELRSVRSASRSAETRKPATRKRPVTATAAPKFRTKRNVYRGHERQGGERSTNRDIAGRKIRTKNMRSAKPISGGAYSYVSPYQGRPKVKEGERFRRSRALPSSARSISRPAETKTYRKSDVYASRRNFRTPRRTGVVQAKAPRSVRQPSRRGEVPVYGKKFQAKSVRSVSDQDPKKRKRKVAPPVSITSQRKRYRQKNVYRDKDRRFSGERSTTKDIAGRKLRTRNYRSGKPDDIGSGYSPYYGRSAPAGTQKKYRFSEPRTSKRAGWNNAGQPLTRKGRGRSGAAAARYTGRMPISAMPGYGKSKAASYTGKIPSKLIMKYKGGYESTFSGRQKYVRPLKGGGSVSRRGWNNQGQPLLRKGRTPLGDAISQYKGRMPLSAMPSYGKSRSSGYTGNIPKKSIQKYKGGNESLYAGRIKTVKPLKGGGSITRRWNNNEQPLIGKGRSPHGEKMSNFTGRLPISAMPSYSKSRSSGYTGNIPAKSIQKYKGGNESLYAGRIKTVKPLKGGGSISRMWNNREQPLARRRSPDAERISNYKGKMPLSAMPSYGKSRSSGYTGNIPAKSIQKYKGGNESLYAGRMKAKKPLKGGGSITRLWNNNEQPLARRRSPDAERISNYKGKMPLSAMPSYSKSRSSGYTGNIPAKSIQKYKGGNESLYAGRMKAKKPLKGGGSITRQWNNNEQPLARRRSPDAERISNYKGKMPLSAMPSYGPSKGGVYAGNLKSKKPIKGGGGSITRQWNNNEQPITRDDIVVINKGIANYKGKLPTYLLTGYGQSPGTKRGRTRSFTFLRIGDPTHMGLHEETARTDRNNRLPDEIKGGRRNRITQSPGTERGRTRSLSFVEIMDPDRGGLHKEFDHKKQNRKLPSELSRKERMRLVEAGGMRNAKATTFSFWAFGNPTQGGLVKVPAQAKGRLHPSSSYTKGYKPRNSVEEKDKPVKVKIWWAKLFKKNANQPKAAKEKGGRRPRYDKDERSIWETAERPNWYNN